MILFLLSMNEQSLAPAAGFLVIAVWIKYLLHVSLRNAFARGRDVNGYLIEGAQPY